MRTELQTSTRRQPVRLPWALGFCLFAAIAAARFGPAWNSYAARTPRWFPRLGGAGGQRPGWPRHARSQPR